MSGSLTVYGHSLADNDDHVLEAISRSTVKRMGVSIYGDPNGPANRQIMRAATDLEQRRDATPGRTALEVRFYDAESAGVWQCG